MNARTKDLGSGLLGQLAALRRRLIQRGRSRGADLDDLIQEGCLRLCLYERSRKRRSAIRSHFSLMWSEKVHIDRMRRATLTRRIFSDRPFEEVDCVDTASLPEQAGRSA